MLGCIHTSDLLGVNYLLNNGLYSTRWNILTWHLVNFCVVWKLQIIGCVPIFRIVWTGKFTQSTGVNERLIGTSMRVFCQLREQNNKGFEWKNTLNRNDVSQLRAGWYLYATGGVQIFNYWM